jgi:hypothetical protein
VKNAPLGPLAAAFNGKRRREKVRLGPTWVNRSDLAGLRRAWQAGDLVLALGAGVSIPYGLPSWNTLVLELLFEQAQGTRRLGTMWPHYRRAVAAWMTEYFAYSPLVLARVVERELWQRRKRGVGNGPEHFLRRLRDHMYANERRPAARTALKAIADLIAASRRGRGGVAAVITFNFDDLLERELAARRIPFRSVADGRRPEGGGIPIIHAHGFLPTDGSLSRDHIVFTEQDYHRLTESVFHWALAEVVDRLRKNTVLFVGLSMSDPSLRRLLDASRNCDIPPHWQIQKRHNIRDHEMLAAMADVEKRARVHAEYLGTGFDERKKPTELQDAIQRALAQADTYDREVFQSMGVKTIWVDEFDHIVAVLDGIARTRQR